MEASQLAQQLWPQIKSIADHSGFIVVRRIDIVVGSLLHVSAQAFEEEMEKQFIGTNFDGASATVRIVEPGEQLKAPGRSDLMTASGYDLLITSMAGERE